MEKLENEKLDFGDLKMLISPVSMIWVQDELGQDELGDGIFKFWGKLEMKKRRYKKVERLERIMQC